MQNFCMYLAAALLLLGGHHAAAQLDKAQMVSLQTLGECGNKDGINSSISTCQTIGKLRLLVAADVIVCICMFMLL